MVEAATTTASTTRKRFSPFLRKPLWVIHYENNTKDPTQEQQHEQQPQQDQSQRLAKHLTLLDLVSIGVGGTIGSGVFVLCGLIARDYAGPATCISWLISGIAAFLSGFCYAELSAKIPSSGSSYAFSFVAMGELPAFVTASMLTLEFLVSGSAVARSWGDKVIEYWIVEWEVPKDTLIHKYHILLPEPYEFINLCACFICIITSLLVYKGVKESKIVTDVFTWLKVCLVVFMSIYGLFLFDSNNVFGNGPNHDDNDENNRGGFNPYGFQGIMRGATSSFFGYLGYDGICCVGGEAINAKKNLPKSILITLVLVTVLYIVAAFSLTGMQYYKDISPESGFPEAFASNHVYWAAQVTACGEIFTLPVVVLLSSVLQPRLTYALSKDGFLPKLFGTVDRQGNLKNGILVSSIIMTLFATFVPFHYLDDFVSAGILIAFCITNSSLLILRLENNYIYNTSTTATTATHTIDFNNMNHHNRNNNNNNTIGDLKGQHQKKQQHISNDNNNNNMNDNITTSSSDVPSTTPPRTSVFQNTSGYLLEKIILISNLLSFATGICIRENNLFKNLHRSFIALLFIFLVVFLPSFILNYYFPSGTKNSKKNKGPQQKGGILRSIYSKQLQQYYRDNNNDNNNILNNDDRNNDNNSSNFDNDINGNIFMEDNGDDIMLMNNSSNNNDEFKDEYNLKDNEAEGDQDVDDEYFQTPLVPYIPLFGNFINWYLISQLSYWSHLLLTLYIVFAITIYYSYGANHSIGNTIGWDSILEDNHDNLNSHSNTDAGDNDVHRHRNLRRRDGNIINGVVYGGIATTDNDNDDHDDNNHTGNGDLGDNGAGGAATRTVSSSQRQEARHGVEMVNITR